MHTDINDVPVRVEKVAMLENPTKFNQTKFLLTVAKKGIAAHISDTGDVYVSKSFFNDLALEGLIDHEMEGFLLKNDVEKIIFVDSMITR